MTKKLTAIIAGIAAVGALGVGVAGATSNQPRAAYSGFGHCQYGCTQTRNQGLARANTGTVSWRHNGTTSRSYNGMRSRGTYNGMRSSHNGMARWSHRGSPQTQSGTPARTQATNRRGDCDDDWGDS